MREDKSHGIPLNFEHPVVLCVAACVSLLGQLGTAAQPNACHGNAEHCQTQPQSNRRPGGDDANYLRGHDLRGNGIIPGFIGCFTGYISEAAASVVSQKLQLNNVPLTTVARLSSANFNYSYVRRKLDVKMPQVCGSSGGSVTQALSWCQICVVLFVLKACAARLGGERCRHL